MARNSKAAAADKPLSIPQLIQRFNDESAKAKDAKRAADACRDAIKAWAEKVGNKTSPTEIYAEKVVDGHTCIVHLGISSGFSPDVAAVVKRFGIDTCLAEDLLKGNLVPLRKLAAKQQIPMTALGEVKDTTVSLDKCEAVKKGATRG